MPDQSYIEHDRWGWWVIFPATPGEGMDTCTGPHFTRLGARLSAWFNRAT